MAQGPTATLKAILEIIRDASGIEFSGDDNVDEERIISALKGLLARGKDRLTVDPYSNEQPYGSPTLSRDIPVSVRFMELEQFMADPVFPVIRAAVPGGIGTLIWDISRSMKDPETGKKSRQLIPIAIVLPIDQVRRLTLRAEGDENPVSLPSQAQSPLGSS